jgi:hypothetical protein
MRFSPEQKKFFTVNNAGLFVFVQWFKERGEKYQTAAGQY